MRFDDRQLVGLYNVGQLANREKLKLFLGIFGNFL
jgi:hypothetical protein